MNEDTKNSEEQGPLTLADQKIKDEAILRGNYQNWLTRPPYYLPRPNSQIVPSQWYSEQQASLRQQVLFRTESRHEPTTGYFMGGHLTTAGSEGNTITEITMNTGISGLRSWGALVNGSGAFSTLPDYFVFKDGLDPKNNNYFE